MSGPIVHVIWYKKGFLCDVLFELTKTFKTGLTCSSVEFQIQGEGKVSDKMYFLKSGNSQEISI